MEGKNYDFIVIGSGAAGLSAAQYASRAAMSTLLLDESLPGGQISNIPVLENYPGVYPPINGNDFIQNLKDQAKSFGSEFIQTSVIKFEKQDKTFIIETSSGTFLSPSVCIATGAEHRKLSVKGEKEFEGRGVSYCATCDGPFFRNKDVIVVGGGDSACTEATYLAELCSHVTVVHRKGQFRAQKAVAERVLSNPKITVRFNATVSEILGEKKVKAVSVKDTLTGTETTLDTAAVFIFAGMIPRTSLFPNLKLDNSGYIITNEDMETSIQGLYAAGDVRSKSFRQIVTACSDGAIAAHSAEQYVRSLRGEEYK